MKLYLEGMLFGVIPVFFVGPVLFTLLHASLRDGFRAGAWVATGIAVSDVVAIALVALGLGPILTTGHAEWLLEIVGGAILLGFGVVLVGRRAPRVEVNAPPRRVVALFAAGFLVNFVNPFVFAFWIGAIGGVTARHGFGLAPIASFFAGTVTTIYVTDLLKARLASALERRLTDRARIWTQRASGLALLGFGLYLVGTALASWPKLGSG